MSSLQSIVLFLEASKYVLLFVGSYIEGTAVMLPGGVLWRPGQVEFWPAYTALLAGDFLADLVWYGVGYFGNVLAFVPRELQYALAVVIVVAAFFGLRALNARLARADW